MGTHMLYLESITHHKFQFGRIGFKHLFPSMVLVWPFSLRKSSRSWPTIKKFPQAHHLCGPICLILLWIKNITPLQQVYGCIWDFAFKPLWKPLRILKFGVLCITKFTSFFILKTSKKQPKSDKCSTWLTIILDKSYWTCSFWLGNFD
jgi:hypothetical protein